MKTIRFALCAVFLSAFSVTAADNMKAFPPAEDGMVRYVLHLPKQKNESNFKVQLVVGKTMKADARNRHFLSGKIESESIQGWGFTKYTVKKIGPMASTRMVGGPKVDRFVTLGGEPYMVRYNSRLPIVIYVPEDAEVRYHIWSAGEEKVMPKG